MTISADERRVLTEDTEPMNKVIRGVHAPLQSLARIQADVGQESQAPGLAEASGEA